MVIEVLVCFTCLFNDGFTELMVLLASLSFNL